MLKNIEFSCTAFQIPALAKAIGISQDIIWQGN
jgi:hypothetical protein